MYIKDIKYKHSDNLLLSLNQISSWCRWIWPEWPGWLQRPEPVPGGWRRWPLQLNICCGGPPAVLNTWNVICLSDQELLPSPRVILRIVYVLWEVISTLYIETLCICGLVAAVQSSNHMWFICICHLIYIYDAFCWVFLNLLATVFILNGGIFVEGLT